MHTMVGCLVFWVQIFEPTQTLEQEV
jgi:hypothetical protein